MDAPAYYSAGTLAAAAKIGRSTLSWHVRRNTAGIAAAKKKIPGIGTRYANNGTVQNFIALCLARPERALPRKPRP